METLDMPEFSHMNVILQQIPRQILKRENPEGLPSVSLKLIDQRNGSTTHEEGAHWENEAGSVALIKVPPHGDVRSGNQGSHQGSSQTQELLSTHS